MIGALQAEAYRVTKDPVYLDRIGGEMAVYLSLLQQPNGLLYHGSEGPFYWGRGNGWVAAGLAEVLSVMPTDHPAASATTRGRLSQE